MASTCCSGVVETLQTKAEPVTFLIAELQLLDCCQGSTTIAGSRYPSHGYTSGRRTRVMPRSNTGWSISWNSAMLTPFTSKALAAQPVDDDRRPR